ncbi:uncharacterized protein N0V89_008904 [Didymosphaeria variabile]|uniref:Beta-lactamase/transpeptidase-like protein n=1 Tax=Didymosphaeria variabile TaxID=1932322 RepID=A0A9W8XH44_9PLEO|nr:uncharacterized protein N0V89_008904 [Didymosphaeria variabile]KAJ4350283.1 hypothetical protein N0V89_008904 [Didymosphaeria variabile]
MAYISTLWGSLCLLFLCSITLTLAQTAPNCPLGPGSIYPLPGNPLHISSFISSALSNLNQTLTSTLQDCTSTLTTSNVSFHFSIFSSSSTFFEYNHIAPGQEHSLSNGDIDRNTVFRIGSVSKLLTVYTLLATTGINHLNDPVTKWIPELAAKKFEDEISTAKWADVTIGALAGHMAGVKELSMEDLATLYDAETAAMYNLPPLPMSDVPTCGTAGELPACSREEFFAAFTHLRPVTSPFNMPIYSNVAFQILTYAIEAMTNQSFADVFQSALVGPLGLNGTYLTMPPGDGTSSANGLMYSTGADLAALGQSILSSTLLPPHVTRQWLKPITHTPDLRLSVGMPWEIFRLEVPVPFRSSGSSEEQTTRIIDLYLKNGGTETYNTQFLLSPDHGFGFALLTAGPPPTRGPDMRFAAMQEVNEMITSVLLPAFEAAMQDLAIAKFAGNYTTSRENASSTNLEIVAGDGGLGLSVKSWMDKGGTRDLLKTYFAALQMAESNALEEDPSLRLYPVGLQNRGEVAFRGVFEYQGSAGAFSDSNTTAFGSRCGAFAAVDEPQYGNVGLDDFVFGVDSAGMATSIAARGMRITLRRL